MATKAIKILVHIGPEYWSKLQQPPLFNGHFFRLYLPSTITLAPNASCQVNLKFQIIIPECISKQIILLPIFRGEFIKINTNDLNTDLIVQVYLDLGNKSRFFIYKIPAKTEIARLYLLSEYKLGTVYKLIK